MNNPNIPSERWKKMEEFPNYSVSDAGRIRNDKTGTIRKQRVNKNGYWNLTFKKNGGAKTIRGHREVMKAFKGDSDLFVDHINGDKLDNRLENLRYATHQQNMLYEKQRYIGKYTGVTEHKDHKRKNPYWARIMVNGKQESLGSFETREEAQAEYEKAIKTVIAAPTQEIMAELFGGDACEHEWIDIRNEVIKSGEMCSKCMKLKSGNKEPEQ